MNVQMKYMAGRMLPHDLDFLKFFIKQNNCIQNNRVQWWVSLNMVINLQVP